MAVKQNAIDFIDEYRMAAKVVETSSYVDDCLTGADNVKATAQDLLSRGAFLLRKCNSIEPSVFIAQKLPDSKEVHPISDTSNYTKILGLEWNTYTKTLSYHVQFATR